MNTQSYEQILMDAIIEAQKVSKRKGDWVDQGEIFKELQRKGHKISFTGRKEMNTLWSLIDRGLIKESEEPAYVLGRGIGELIGPSGSQSIYKNPKFNRKYTPEYYLALRSNLDDRDLALLRYRSKPIISNKTPRITKPRPKLK